MKETLETYRLEYGYMHCVGRTVYTAGTVDSEEQARAWVTARSEMPDGKRCPPDADPIRWCPVRHCHMKRQAPWFAYRKS